MVALVIFTAFSLACGLAQTMSQLYVTLRISHIETLLPQASYLARLRGLRGIVGPFCVEGHSFIFFELIKVTELCSEPFKELVEVGYIALRWV